MNYGDVFCGKMQENTLIMLEMDYAEISTVNNIDNEALYRTTVI